jgi:HlyD family secretion protein
MRKKAVKALVYLAGAVALLLLILYSGGFLTTGKIGPGYLEAASQTPPSAGRARAELTTLTDYYQAVGTVRPRTEVKVESQVPGRVRKITVTAGSLVEPGQLLVQLDDRQYRAKVAQARHGLEEVRAGARRAKSEYARAKKLLAGEAATPQDMERAREAFQRAASRVSQAQKQVEEAEVALGFTRIKASQAGRVIKRLTEPGDMALPGRPLLLLQTQGAHRLEALLREGLIGKVRLGQELQVRVPALKRSIKGVVEEISPSADPATRSFLIKVGLAEQPGLYPGMFGRLLVPVGSHQAVLVPASAITRVGQLEMVNVEQDGRWQRVYITSGRRVNGKVEVLSGLSGGEPLALESSPDAR